MNEPPKEHWNELTSCNVGKVTSNWLLVSKNSNIVIWAGIIIYIFVKVTHIRPQMESLMLSPMSAYQNLIKFLGSGIPEKEGIGQPVSACLLCTSYLSWL